MNSRAKRRRFVTKINSISKLVQTNYTNLFVCVTKLSVCGKQKKTTSEILVIKINRSGEREGAGCGAPTGRLRPGGPPSTSFCITTFAILHPFIGTLTKFPFFMSYYFVLLVQLFHYLLTINGLVLGFFNRIVNKQGQICY